MNNRILSAVDSLKEGKPFKIDDLRLSIAQSGEIEIAGASQFLNLENITKAIAETELSEIKALFIEMLGVSEELKVFMLGKAIEYRLYYDVAEKSWISICSEKDGILQWEVSTLRENDKTFRNDR